MPRSSYKEDHSANIDELAARIGVSRTYLQRVLQFGVSIDCAYEVLDTVFALLPPEAKATIAPKVVGKVWEQVGKDLDQLEEFVQDISEESQGRATTRLQRA